jgi:hypothetical protein
MKMFIFLTGKPRPSGRGGFNFSASLHQDRFTKWSRINSSGSQKSVSATWIAERIYDSYYNHNGSKRNILMRITIAFKLHHKLRHF